MLTHLKKSKIKWEPLSNYGKAYYGVVTGMDKAFVITRDIISNYNLEEELIKKYAFKGEEVNRYELTNPFQYTIYPYQEDDEGNSVLLSDENLKNNFPNIYNYLEQFRNQLELRKDSRKLYAQGDNWFRHVRPGNFNLIKAEKIQVRGIGKKVLAGLLERDTCFSGANCPAIIIENEILKSNICLGILNSKLITNYLNNVCPKKLGGYIRYNTKNISNVPIIIPSEDIENEIECAVKKIIKLNTELDNSHNTFSRYIGFHFPEKVLTKKLQNWHTLDFGQFIKEFNKAIKNTGSTALRRTQEIEWMEVFETKIKEVQTIREQIDELDYQIDQLVYELYGLTEEKIKIIEN